MKRTVLITTLLLATSASGVEPTPAALTWATSKMTRWTAPGTNIHVESSESAEQAQERYESIAKDAFEVVFDDQEPALFKGKNGKLKTWATLLSVAHFESSFRDDVDRGIGTKSRGDHGQSWCLMQIKLGKAVKGKTNTRINLDTPYAKFTTKMDEGFGGEDLVQDRKLCFKAALHVMRTSFSMCKALPEDERLAAYASGTCDKGRQSSRWRVGKALRWVSQGAPSRNDEDLIQKSEELDASYDVGLLND